MREEKEYFHLLKWSSYHAAMNVLTNLSYFPESMDNNTIPIYRLTESN